MDTTKLQEQVTEYIKVSVEKIGDFASKEIPPFINEYITWKFYENLFPITLYVLGMMFILFIVYKVLIPLCKWAKESSIKEADSIYYILPILSSMFLIAVPISTFPYDNIKNCIQIKVAPKVYLIEQASNIIKSNIK